MEPETETCEDVEKPNKKRRSSILKASKSRSPFEDIDITETCTDMNLSKPIRRVSFASSNFVKPFAADPEKNTIWDITYEEVVNHTNSTHSSQEPTNSSTKFGSTLYTSSSVVISNETNVTNIIGQDMELTKVVSFLDKENIPICPSNRVSIVDLAKKRSGSAIIPAFELSSNGPRLTIFEDSDNSSNVTHSVQNIPSLMKNNENLVHTHANHAAKIHREPRMEFTEIPLLEPEEDREEQPMFDASAMEFTGQLPAEKSKILKTNVTNMSQSDMEFTRHIPQSLKTSVNMDFTCNETRNLTKGVDDLEFTCQMPQGNVTKASEDMEFTRHGMQNVTNVSNMEFTCQIPQSMAIADMGPTRQRTQNMTHISNMESGCQKSQTNLTKATEDMEFTRHETQNMTNVSHMDFTCQLPESNLSRAEMALSRHGTQNITNVSHMEHTRQETQNVTNVNHWDSTCQKSQANLTKSSENMEFTRHENQNLTNVSHMDFTCQIPQNMSRPDITNFTKATEDMEFTRHGTQTNVSHMDFTCQIPQNMSRPDITNFTKPTEDMEFTRHGTQNLTNGSHMEFTCQIPQNNLSRPDMELSRHGTQNMTNINHMESICHVSQSNLSKADTEFTCQKSQANLTKATGYETRVSEGNLTKTHDNMEFTCQVPHNNLPIEDDTKSISQANELESSGQIPLQKSFPMDIHMVTVNGTPGVSNISSTSTRGQSHAHRDPNLANNSKIINNDETKRKSVTAGAVIRESFPVDIHMVTVDKTPHVSKISSISICEQSHTHTDATGASNSKIISDERIDISQRKCLTAGVIKDVSHVKDVSSNLLMKMDNECNSTRNVILSQTSAIPNDENKSMSMDLSGTKLVNKVGVGKVSPLKGTLSQTATTNLTLSRTCAITEDVNVNLSTLRTKCVDKEVNQSKIMLSKTVTEIDDLTQRQSCTITKNVNKTYRVNGTLTTGMEYINATDATLPMNKSRIKCQNKAAISQTKDLLSKTSEIDSACNARHSQNENSVDSSRTKSVRRVDVMEESQPKDGLSKKRMNFDNAQNKSTILTVDIEAECHPAQFSSQQKSSDMEIGETLSDNRSVDNFNAKSIGRIDSKNLILECNTAQEVVCNKSKPKDHEVNLENMSEKAQVDGGNSGNSPAVSKTEKSLNDYEYEKENIVSNRTHVKSGLHAINTSLGPSAKNASPKVTNIPIRANSTLLNTPERLSRFATQNKESPDLMRPRALGDPNLRTPKQATLGNSFHINFNISSSVDDTQLLCSYSKSNPGSCDDTGGAMEPKEITDLEDTKNSPDISSYENRKLSNINDTYVLKRKHDAVRDTIKDATTETDEDDTLGLVAIDAMEVMGSELETMQSVNYEAKPAFSYTEWASKAAGSGLDTARRVEYELEPPPYKINRSSEISDLLETIKRQKVAIRQFLENVKFRPMAIPRQLPAMVENSSDNSETLKDVSEEVPVHCPSIEDKIRKHQESCQNCWKLEKIEDEFYHFSTLFGVLGFILQISVESGNVYDLQTVNKLSGTSTPLARFVLKLLLDKFNSNVIRSAIGEHYDILSFLDYVQMSMLRLHQFTINFQLSDLVTMDEDFVAKYTISSIHLVFSVEILVDVRDIDNLKYEKDVTIVPKIGNVNENEVKNLVQNCPKGLDFFTRFEQNIQEYLQLKEKRKRLERTHH